jgi:hypothetical protein
MLILNYAENTLLRVKTLKAKKVHSRKKRKFHIAVTEI